MVNYPFIWRNLFELRKKWPPTYLSRRWPPLATYLGGDGQQSTYLEKDGQLFIYFAGVYLSVYLPI